MMKCLQCRGSRFHVRPMIAAFHSPAIRVRAFTAADASCMPIASSRRLSPRPASARQASRRASSARPSRHAHARAERHDISGALLRCDFGSARRVLGTRARPATADAQALPILRPAALFLGRGQMMPHGRAEAAASFGCLTPIYRRPATGASILSI